MYVPPFTTGSAVWKLENKTAFPWKVTITS